MDKAAVIGPVDDRYPVVYGKPYFFEAAAKPVAFGYATAAAGLVMVAATIAVRLLDEEPGPPTTLAKVACMVGLGLMVVGAIAGCRGLYRHVRNTDYLAQHRFRAEMGGLPTSPLGAGGARYEPHTAPHIEAWSEALTGRPGEAGYDPRRVVPPPHLWDGP